jgi:membrane protease YdiL (CAAX protease family)
MNSTTANRPAPATTVDPGPSPELRPLLVFAAIAVPTGWFFLSIPLLLDLPDAPFVLATLLLGLVVPALALSRRDHTTSARALLRATFRRPRPLAVLVPALAAVPALTWAGARLAGAEQALDTDLLVGLAVTIGSSLLIINLWEEMAWTGFFQSRAMARWGTVAGSLVTAALFVGIHLPLAFHGNPLVGLAALVVSGIGMRFLVAGVWSWSARSTIAVAVLHASFNAAADVVDADHDWIRYVVTVTLGVLALPVLVSRRSGSAAR